MTDFFRVGDIVKVDYSKTSLLRFTKGPCTAARNHAYGVIARITENKSIAVAFWESDEWHPVPRWNREVFYSMDLDHDVLGECTDMRLQTYALVLKAEAAYAFFDEKEKANAKVNEKAPTFKKGQKVLLEATVIEEKDGQVRLTFNTVDAFDYFYTSAKLLTLDKRNK